MTIREVEVIQQDPITAVARFVGEHDLSTSDERDALLQRLVGDNDLVVIDLHDATFIDSSFLHSLAKADRSARNRQSTVQVQLGLNSGVEQTLRISGLLTHLEILAPPEALAPPSPLPEDFTQAVA